ncbi:hypothetical protein SAMN02910447_01668 [Ruminococcus sp. YE71]|uniref:hypothetical protein n=1 Tax=unclassified Ruminococcus TaxID=2608920 RepID=UPI00088711FA|nr:MULTISPECIES: hypothetical protein [unclassified Ruminococcus]SDA20030.1 hypothetical protein SAMN02910446_01669 [Ruminococcus sp. YE78]SFW31732.1 hypothetical protein SAMN02910447_01668 [Ruminococcus sp. YE71]
MDVIGGMTDTAKQKVLEAFNEMKNTQYRTIEDAVEEYGAAYVFDCWLRHEGIIGYTRQSITSMHFATN